MTRTNPGPTRSNSSVVASYRPVNAVNGTVSSVDETVYSTTPDQYFRGDSTAQQWIFDHATGKNTNLSAAPATYFQIMLIDGTVIGPGTAVPGAAYQCGLK